MWNKLIIFIFVLAISFVILGGYESGKLASSSLWTQHNETAYECIMRTRTIRCGYFVWPPFTVKDANTGKLSGLNSDFMAILGKVLDVKIEWTQELNFSTYLQDLADGRYDMECADGWPNGKRGQMAYFSKPFAFMPSVILIRANDNRFDRNQSLINSPDVTIATIDGETSSVIHDSQFPQTKQVSLPSNTLFGHLILNVTTRKADVTFLDLASARQYDEQNPGLIKILNYDHPVNLIALGPTLPQDEKLEHMINTAIDQIQNSGQIEALLQKYEDKGSLFLRVNAPYQH